MDAPLPALDAFVSGPSGLRVVIAPDAGMASELAITALCELLFRAPPHRVSFATGATFHEFFKRLVERERRGLLDLRSLEATHLDELDGCDAGARGGMAHEIAEVFLSRLRSGIRAFHPVARSASEHASRLANFGTLQLQLAGIGPNGHIGFNEPGTSFADRVHEAELAPETRARLGTRFGSLPCPARAITSGPRDVLEAERLCLLATGSQKADAVRAMLEDPISPNCPASLVRLHRKATVILDPAAASRLGPRARWTPERVDTQVIEARSLKPRGSVVVIAPHPDDASISCGGLLASLPEDVPRCILTMTTGARSKVPGVAAGEAVAALREQEVLDEAAFLGAEARFLRGRFYDSGAFEEADARSLLAELRRLDPAWILAPSLRDPHPTHRLARQILDDALDRRRSEQGAPVEVWTFEGPWYQHPARDVNAIVTFGESAESRKLAAVRAHQSQLARVPFDEGARALARLRAVTFSESHLGGTEPGRLRELPRVEAYIRERY